MYIITLNLTNWDKFKLLLSFLFLNTSSLVKIDSRIKTTGVLELMESNDYKKYEMQMDEYKKICDEYKKTEDYVKFKKNHNNMKMYPKFTSYYLAPGNTFWCKME